MGKITKPAGQGHFEKVERLYDVDHWTNRLSAILFNTNIILLIGFFAPYAGWQSALVFVHPGTVIAWQRKRSDFSGKPRWQERAGLPKVSSDTMERRQQGLLGAAGCYVLDAR